MEKEIKVERDGIDECVRKVNEAIEQLSDAAASIDTAMGNLYYHWAGAAYETAMSTYQEQYKSLLTSTVPQTVESFRDYINDCMVKITELDAQLAGN